MAAISMLSAWMRRARIRVAVLVVKVRHARSSVGRLPAALQDQVGYGMSFPSAMMMIGSQNV